ncbi:MAG TPA: prepilin peptidase, partial [Usitatibacteraceae bacterium]|nr:prepilin peptidase [Usitatibacteraceae bacterium]
MDIALLKASPAFVTFAAGVLGLAVGSFLNVVVHRMPRMMRAEWKGECEEFMAEEAEAARPARPWRA